MIARFAYSPNPTTVAKGGTVTVTNTDGTAHSWTSEGVFESGDLAPGASNTIALSSPGTYDYHCRFHASMKGSITVV